jgi:NADH:quinone reductase (non-electrogenic)
VIDRHNYHLFQPLPYQVATAALSPADIAEPIRVVLRRQRNATVLLDEVTGVDPARRLVRTRIGSRQSYDWLILATGSQYTYFGHADWPRLAPGLKSVDDATLIRRRVLLAFEQAETVPDPVLRHRLLTFILVGGGRPLRCADRQSWRDAYSLRVVGNGGGTWDIGEIAHAIAGSRTARLRSRLYRNAAHRE